MSPTRTLHGRRRELAVLVLAAISAALLISAALAPFSDPLLASQASFARLAGQVSDSVIEEWERLLHAPEPPAPACSPDFRWSARAEPGSSRPSAPFDEPNSIFAADAVPDSAACAALLAEAERVELELADLDLALDLVVEALEKRPSARQRAAGRLAGTRLAVALERPELASRWWREAAAELQGGEERDGSAYLLMHFLVASRVEGVLSEADRERMLDLWCSGRLSLPAGELRLNADPLADPAGAPWIAQAGFEMQDALAARLAGITAQSDPAARLAHASERRAAGALERFLGKLPESVDDGRWHLRAVQDVLLLFRAGAGGGGSVQACFARRADLERSLIDALERRELLPAGFRLDFGGEREGLGPVVRERRALQSADLGFVLRHADPQGHVSAEGRRLLALRAALFVMAFFAAAGGLATFRALRRERKAAEARALFVANVSHELRTPLSSILLMAENLESGRVREPAQAARYHALIRREALRLRELVDGVLDFSRLERGKPLELRIEETDLHAWGAGLGVELSAWATQGGAELAFAQGGLPESARLDPEALRRALHNLLENAMRHSGSKSIEVELSARGHELVLAVQDRGRGVPAAQRERIFEPFERLGGANGATPGTGLGLSIVRAIAAAHGGSVRVTDAAPGARFEMRLPLAGGSGVPETHGLAGARAVHPSGDEA